MVKKRDSRVDDQKLKRAGGVTTLDDLKDEETEADTVDGPGSPYQYQRAPSRSGEDVTDSPGYRTGGGRRSKIRAVTDVMLRVADELDSNEEMWSLFSKLDLTPDTAYDTFREVAMGIFTHGVSWGKIAVLFMFAAHCVIKAVLSELPNILLMLASFVAQFFGESLRQWIEDHGGWVRRLQACCTACQAQQRHTTRKASIHWCWTEQGLNLNFF